MAEALFRQTRGAATAPKPAAIPRHPLWYAVHLPGLCDEAQPGGLEQIAACCLQISDHVSLLAPTTVLCEVAGSIRYFGGIEHLHQHLQNLLQVSCGGWQHRYAMSPSASASALLAAHEQQRLITRKTQLRSALGPLPISALPLPANKQRLLRHSGLHHLRDLWRLPRATLRKRLGNAAADHLACCLGQRAEAPPRWRPAWQFRQALNLEWPQDNHHMLLQGCEHLLSALCHCLRQRELLCAQLQFRLLHERREHSQVEVGLRQPSRQLQQLLLLTDAALQQLTLPAAVIEIELSSHELIEASSAAAQQLAGIPGADHSSAVDQLLEQLQARLGKHAIHTLSSSNSHDPAQAGRIIHAEPTSRPHSRESSAGVLQPAFSRLAPRPGWLIEPPRALECRGGRPCHQGPLQLISGPERLHTHWWEAEPLQRDYYVASNARGLHLWIFRDLSQRDREHWYLHGLF